jgi:hypothetical protein
MRGTLPPFSSVLLRGTHLNFTIILLQIQNRNQYTKTEKKWLRILFSSRESSISNCNSENNNPDRDFRILQKVMKYKYILNF